MPNTKLKILGTVAVGQATDREDWTLLEIENPNDGFVADPKDFERPPLDRQAIIVVGISIFAYEYVFHRDIGTWPLAVRFSRVNASRLFDGTEDVGSAAGDFCLYHRSPTYPGMSGAPMFGVWLDNGVASFGIVGMHLRNGVTDQRADEDQKNCGSFPEYNVGVKLSNNLTDTLSGEN